MAKKASPKGGKKPEKMDPAVHDLFQRKQLETVLLARAVTDGAFRKKFLADPKGTLKATIGVDLGKIKVVVMEETADTVYVSLPPMAAKEGELSDEQLEAVAGGRGSSSGGSSGGAAVSGGTCRLANDIGANTSRMGGGDWLIAAGTFGVGGAIGFSWLWNG